MIPPNNVAAERHLLGVLLREAAHLPGDLHPSDFFEPAHQDIAAAMLSLAVDGVAPDELTVSQRLRQVNSPVTEATVSLLVSDAGQAAFRLEHADMISDAAILRRALVAAEQATDPDTLLDHSTPCYPSSARKTRRASSATTAGSARAARS
jgi:replicative DNA helicase